MNEMKITCAVLLGTTLLSPVAFAGSLPAHSKLQSALRGVVGEANGGFGFDIAWKVRHKLNLDNVPGGVSPTKDDNIVYDISNGASAGGWGHPACAPKATEIAKELPKTHPIGPKP